MSYLFKIAIALLLCLPLNGYGQSLDSTGIDNTPQLNDNEAAYFNQLFSRQRGSYDLAAKKVLFIKGSSGYWLSSKPEFFNYVKDEVKSDSSFKPSTSLYILNDEERQLLQGYDAIIPLGVKVKISPSTIKALHEALMKKHDE